MSKIKNLAGNIFGELTAIEITTKNSIYLVNPWN